MSRLILANVLLGSLHPTIVVAQDEDENAVAAFPAAAVEEDEDDDDSVPLLRMMVPRGDYDNLDEELAGFIEKRKMPKQGPIGGNFGKAIKGSIWDSAGSSGEKKAVENRHAKKFGPTKFRHHRHAGPGGGGAGVGNEFWYPKQFGMGRKKKEAKKKSPKQHHNFKISRFRSPKNGKKEYQEMLEPDPNKVQNRGEVGEEESKVKSLRDLIPKKEPEEKKKEEEELEVIEANPQPDPNANQVRNAQDAFTVIDNRQQTKGLGVKAKQASKTTEKMSKKEKEREFAKGAAKARQAKKGGKKKGAKDPREVFGASKDKKRPKARTELPWPYVFFFTGTDIMPPADDDPAANPDLFQTGWPEGFGEDVGKGSGLSERKSEGQKSGGAGGGEGVGGGGFGLVDKKENDERGFFQGQEDGFAETKADAKDDFSVTDGGFMGAVQLDNRMAVAKSGDGVGSGVAVTQGLGVMQLKEEVGTKSPMKLQNRMKNEGSERSTVDDDSGETKTNPTEKGSGDEEEEEEEEELEDKKKDKVKMGEGKTDDAIMVVTPAKKIKGKPIEDELSDRMGREKSEEGEQTDAGEEEESATSKLEDRVGEDDDDEGGDGSEAEAEESGDGEEDEDGEDENAMDARKRSKKSVKKKDEGQEEEGAAAAEDDAVKKKAAIDREMKTAFKAVQNIMQHALKHHERHHENEDDDQ